MMKKPQTHILRPVAGAGDLESPDLVVLYEYWLGLQEDGNLPHSRSIDLLDLGTLLNNVYLFDVLDGGGDYRCVYNGNFHAEQKPALSVGDTVSLMPPSELKDRVRAVFDIVVETKQPVQFGNVSSAREGREYNTIDMICLPLSDDGITVNRTLSALSHSGRPATWKQMSGGLDQT
jgi:hypothetical protein